MLNVLKAAGMAAAMIVAPLAASATTFLTPANSGTSFDLLADDFAFDQRYSVGAPGGSFRYTFTNTSSRLAAITIYDLDVQQRTGAFTGGVQLTFGPESYNVAQGAGCNECEGEFRVGAGESVDLLISFGQVVDNGLGNNRGSAAIDFSVEAAVVPVPAAGLLLLTALGGMAAVRRRKSA